MLDRGARVEHLDVADCFFDAAEPERREVLTHLLRDAGRAQEVAFSGHGLTPDTRSLLIAGTMDAGRTPTPQSVIMNCVQIFSNLRERKDPLAGVEANRISVVLRENLP